MLQEPSKREAPIVPVARHGGGWLKRYYYPEQNGAAGRDGAVGEGENLPASGTWMRLISLCVQLVKKFERGDLPKSDWLDALAFRKMAEIHAVCDLDTLTACPG